MDIKFNIKGLSIVRGHIKAESMDVGFSLSEDETLNSNECFIEMLDNPTIQKLINKFTDEVSFKPAKSAHNDADDKIRVIKDFVQQQDKAHKAEIDAVRKNQERILALLERLSK